MRLSPGLLEAVREIIIVTIIMHIFTNLLGPEMELGTVLMQLCFCSFIFKKIYLKGRVTERWEKIGERVFHPVSSLP